MARGKETALGEPAVGRLGEGSKKGGFANTGVLTLSFGCWLHLRA